MRSYKICKLEAFLSFEIGLGNRNSKPCEKQYQLYYQLVKVLVIRDLEF